MNNTTSYISDSWRKTYHMVYIDVLINVIYQLSFLTEKWGNHVTSRHEDSTVNPWWYLMEIKKKKYIKVLLDFFNGARLWNHDPIHDPTIYVFRKSFERKLDSAVLSNRIIISSVAKRRQRVSFVYREEHRSQNKREVWCLINPS